MTDKLNLIQKKEAIELAIEASLQLNNMVTSNTIEEIIQYGIDKVKEITGSQIGYFHFVDEHTKTLTLTAWSKGTIEQCPMANNGDNPKNNHYPIDEAGIWVDCYYQKKPVIHNDYNSEPHRRGLPEGHVPVKNDLGIPIISDNIVRAILGVGNKKTDYTALDIEMATLIAENIWKSTQIKEASNTIKKQRDKYQVLFNNMPNGYTLHEMIFDSKGNPIDYVFLEQNKASKELIGNIEGQKFSEWSVGKGEFDFVSKFGEVAVTGKSVKFEAFSKTLNRWYSITAYSPIKNHFVTIFDDITIVKEQEQHYQTLVDLLPTAIVVYNTNTKKLVFGNPAACKLLGYDDFNEIIGLKATDFVHPDYQQIVSGRIKRIIETGELAEALNEKFIHKNGESIDVEVIAKPITYRGTPSILVIFQDISEKLSLEEQLRQAAKLEAIGLLAGGVAHDFNNILTVIRGYSEMLYKKIKRCKEKEEPCDVDYILKRIDKISKSSERASKLTKQLLAFSRKQILNPEIVDLNALIIEEKESLHKFIREDIEISYFLDESLGNILIDKNEMQSIIMNLILNSRDAIDGKGNINVETKNIYFDEHHVQRKKKLIEKGSYVMLAITDDGHGMDKETTERVFEPFFTTKEMGKGVGLGLSTVYGIVKQSGGYIWVYSEVDEGTTFKLYFPRVEGENNHQNNNGTQLEYDGDYTGNETILVVEDEHEVREMVVETLREYGYKVKSASNGLDALELVRQEKIIPDLILTDVVMPKMDGRELAIQISEFIPDIKVIYMSGYTDNTIVHRGVLDPGTHFIQKPTTPVHLVKRVREVLNE